jgi:hypothetical protein
MSKQYFFMNLAYWLNLKIKIDLNGRKEIGYLLTPKNQCGEFYLIDRNSKDILLSGKTSKVKSISFEFLNFHSKNKLTILNQKSMKKRAISELPISNCLPIDGNIPKLVLPPADVLINSNVYPEGKNKRFKK